MPSTQDVATNHEYRSLPISTLVESPTNPRKRFDERTLGELAASFKTQGVLEPLLVRPLEEAKYEVVIGARRLKAARLAELENVPVRVVICFMRRNLSCCRRRLYLVLEAGPLSPPFVGAHVHVTKPWKERRAGYRLSAIAFSSPCVGRGRRPGA